MCYLIPDCSIADKLNCKMSVEMVSGISELVKLAYREEKDPDIRFYAQGQLDGVIVSILVGVLIEKLPLVKVPFKGINSLKSASTRLRNWTEKGWSWWKTTITRNGKVREGLVARDASGKSRETIEYEGYGYEEFNDAPENLPGDRSPITNNKIVLFTDINQFRAALARNEQPFYVGNHGDISPRPTGYQSHHGVNSVWMEKNYVGYVANDVPSVYMLNEPNHNATRGVFNTWRSEVARRQGVSISNVNYRIITEQEILLLCERQFNAASVPKIVRDEYYLRWHRYKNTLTHRP
jgi:hypothetical protein